MGSCPRCPCVSGLCSPAVRRAVQRLASPPTPASVGSQHFCCSAPRRADGAVPAPSQLGTRFSFSPPQPLSARAGFGFARPRRFGVTGACVRCVRCVAPPSMLTANRYGGGKESEGLCLRAFMSQKRDSSVDKRGGYASQSCPKSHSVSSIWLARSNSRSHSTQTLGSR